MNQRRSLEVRTRTLLAFGVGMLTLAVATRAQQAPAPPPSPLPLAASSLLLTPDIYVGQPVSVYATVEQSLSATTFSVDQDAAKASPEQLLIIAPSLQSQPEAGNYVTIIGTAMMFDMQELQRRARGYALDLSPAVAERFRGKPVVLATAVFNPAMTDLAKAPIVPPTAEEVAMSNLMKQVNPASAAIRAAVADATLEEVRTQTTLLQRLFEDTRKIFAARNANDAIGWATEGAELAASISASASANRWDEAQEASAKLAPLCQSCHAAYRERLEDGTYRIK